MAKNSSKFFGGTVIPSFPPLLSLGRIIERGVFFCAITACFFSCSGPFGGLIAIIDLPQQAGIEQFLTDTIIWKGSLPADPLNPAEGWAYFNTGDQKAYIYTGGAWQDMSDVSGSVTGWKGCLPAAPADPQEGWAYFNTADNKAYVYHNGFWDLMAGDPPLPEVLWVGAQPDHAAAEAANNGNLVDGLSYFNTTDNKAYIYSGNPGAWREMFETPAAGIIWVGTQANDGAAKTANNGKLEEGLAYFNTVDNKTYIYTNGNWQEMLPMTTYYRVVFDSQGGSYVAHQLVAGGDYATAPSSPSLPGFAFKGWYDAATGGNTFAFDTTAITGVVTGHPAFYATGAGSISRGYGGRGVALNIHPYLAPRLKKE